MSDVSRKDRYNEDYLSSKELLPRPDPTILTTQQLLREVASVREILESRLNGMDKAISLLQAAVDRSPTIPQIYAEFTEKFVAVQQLLKDRDVKLEQVTQNFYIAKDTALLAAKEAVTEQNKTTRAAISADLAGMSKIIDSLQLRLDNMRPVGEVYTEFVEKFRGVQVQFHERDIRFEQAARDNKIAVDAALEAAKEAVGEQNKSSAMAIAKSEAATTKQMDAIGAIIQTSTKSLDDKINDLKDRLALTSSAVTENQRGIIQHAKGFSDGWGYIAGFIGIIVAIISVTLGLLKH
jgi:hypothetical protein